MAICGQPFVWTHAGHAPFHALVGAAKRGLGKHQQGHLRRMLNVAYKGMNGNSNDTMANAEGYKYRGRGFVQVTGKTNYENAQKTCKDQFGVTYGFVAQPQLMEENIAGVWASFAWFSRM